MPKTRLHMQETLHMLNRPPTPSTLIHLPLSVYTMSVSPTTLCTISVLADLTSGAAKEGKPNAHQLWLGSVSRSPLEHLIFAHVKDYEFKMKVHF